MIGNVNKIIKRLDVKPKKKASGTTSSINQQSTPEMKNLRKDTINMVLEGEELLKQIFKTNDLHKNCKILASKNDDYYCTCNANFNCNQDLKKVMQNLRNKL